MDHQMMKTKIEDWFKIYGGGGLVTPEGWFGRPYDNIHQLTYLEFRLSKLIIELDVSLPTAIPKTEEPLLDFLS